MHLCVYMQSQHLVNKCGEIQQDDDKVCVKGCNGSKLSGIHEMQRNIMPEAEDKLQHWSSSKRQTG